MFGSIQFGKIFHVLYSIQMRTFLLLFSLSRLQFDKFSFDQKNWWNQNAIYLIEWKQMEFCAITMTVNNNNTIEQTTKWFQLFGVRAIQMDYHKSVWGGIFIKMIFETVDWICDAVKNDSFQRIIGNKIQKVVIRYDFMRHLFQISLIFLPKYKFTVKNILLLCHPRTAQRWRIKIDRIKSKSSQWFKK